jgi:hypothetical protein
MLWNSATYDDKKRSFEYLGIEASENHEFLLYLETF